jgi:hypothetical protein
VVAIVDRRLDEVTAAVEEQIRSGAEEEALA